MAFFNSQQYRRDLFNDMAGEAVGQSGDHAVAKPVLRMQPKTADQLMQALRRLLQNGQYDKLIKFLDEMYQLAKDGDEVVLNFYQKFDRALTRDFCFRSQIRSYSKLQKLVDWQFAQLSQHPLFKNAQSMEMNKSALVTQEIVTVPTPR
ncbi:MAG: hypothetical protein GKR77_05890 [Legionellales bacterium]|nr:hypothetical protein [Legionellales bacterium]